LPLPPLEPPARQLWDHLVDVGIASEGGMAKVAINWTELNAWRSLSAVVLAPWQARAIIQASRAWVAEHNGAADPEALAPWSDAPAEVDREVVREKVRTIFGARAARKG